MCLFSLATSYIGAPDRSVPTPSRRQAPGRQLPSRGRPVGLALRGSQFAAGAKSPVLPSARPLRKAVA
eukprot:10136338-Lingulodinium_polyedra.AAC.1